MWFMAVSPTRLRALLGGVLVSALIAAMACGSDDATPTTGPGTDPDPTATQPASATATATPTDAQPTEPPGNATGSVSLASHDIRFLIGTPRFNVQQSYMTKAGILEPLVIAAWEDNTKSNLVAEPLLATEWEIASDFSAAEFKIRQGVKFHDGTEMTAEDVAWSYNDANSRVTTESVHDTAGDLAAGIDAFEVIDDETVRMPFVVFTSHFILRNLSTFWESPAVTSKKVFDEHGAEGMRDILVGTGPLQVVEWTRNDRLIMEAFDDYHGVTGMPLVDRVTVLEVPENASRKAMLQTEQVAIANPALNDWEDLFNEGFERAPEGYNSDSTISFGGNWWEETNIVNDEPLERTLDLSKPWIGDINDPERWESARKVREALGLGIRREDINTAIFQGQGSVNYVPGWEIEVEGHKDEWRYDFDPERAQQLMAEAGYADGFTIDWWIGPDDTNQQLAEAIGGQWKNDLNVDVVIDNQVYGTYRPTIVDRTTTSIWFCGADGVNVPLTWPKGFLVSSVSAGGFMCGTEHRPFGEIFLEMANETDDARLRELASEFYDELRRTSVQIGVAMRPVFPIYNPDIVESWEMLPEGKGSLGGFNNLHRIKLK